MGKKIYNANEIKDTHGPMNSVSKEDAEVWANAKAGVDYDEKQIKRIALAKKKKAKTSTKKHDRRMSKQIIKNIEKT
tara:strand:- start:532 stop:762 length:231 start_codon:yes stop_codon:yes gene_type:complete